MGTWVLVLMLYAGTGTAMTNVFGFASEVACTTEGRRWENLGRSTHQYHCLEVKGNGEG
jgi:hypothetical protein